MPFELKQYEPIDYYLYVNPDGSQYIDEQIEEFAKIPDDGETGAGVPDGVQEFWFSLKQLQANVSLASQRRLSDLAVQARTDGKRSQTGSASVDLELAELAQAMQWDVTQNGQVVPCDARTLGLVTPPWILSRIQSKYNTLTKGKNLLSG